MPVRMPATTSSTVRLILWPSLITLAVSITRLVGQLQGWITTRSGGEGALLGITWLAFLCGGWFGIRLRNSGSAPALRPAWLWTLLPPLAFFGAFGYRMYCYQQAGFTMQDQSDAAYEHIRQTLQLAVLVGGVGMLLTFATWARLAWTLLLYGLVARVGVVAITYVAKTQGWDTHYTKLGPGGIEKDLGETMIAACIAQFGMWVPFTVMFGGFVGCLFAKKKS